MQFTIELPLDWIQSNPWVWLVVGAVVWYTVAGVVMRLTSKMETTAQREKTFIVWVLSPLVVIVVAALTVVSVILWPLSMGIVQPTWRWKGDTEGGM